MSAISFLNIIAKKGVNYHIRGENKSMNIRYMLSKLNCTLKSSLNLNTKTVYLENLLERVQK